MTAIPTHENRTVSTLLLLGYMAGELTEVRATEAACEVLPHVDEAQVANVMAEIADWLDRYAAWLDDPRQAWDRYEAGDAAVRPRDFADWVEREAAAALCEATHAAERLAIANLSNGRAA